MSHNIVVFSDNGVWSLMIQVFILGMALLAGNTIRRRVPIINRCLVPSALLGGLVIFLLKFIPAFNSLVNVEIMQMITYHCLGLGFAAITLKEAKDSRKAPVMKVVENGCMTGATYILQGIVGVLISIILYKTAVGTFYAAGFITPMGYGQGPGSALSWGSIYETSHGFAGGASFGLTIASIGFIVASVVGVVYMNLQIRKGNIVPRVKRTEDKSIEEFEGANEVPQTESIDRLTLQLAFIFTAYFLAYMFMKLLQASGIGVLQDLAWGLNFLWAILAAFVIKAIVVMLKKTKLMHRQYMNNYLMDRVSGFMFDFMIIAGVAAIRFEDVRANWLAISLICTAAAVVTFIYVFIVTKNLYKGYSYEMFICNFGMLTGTVSNGMILLREIDPNYDTPTANNQVMQNFPAILFGAPCLLLLGIGARSLQNCYMVLGIFICLFILYSIFLFRRKIFKKHYDGKEDIIWSDDGR